MIAKQLNRNLKDFYNDKTISGNLARSIIIYYTGYRNVDFSHKTYIYEKKNGTHSYTKNYRKVLRIMSGISYQDILKINLDEFANQKGVGKAILKELATFQDVDIEEKKDLEREKIRDAIYFLTEKGYRVSWEGQKEVTK